MRHLERGAAELGPGRPLRCQITVRKERVMSGLTSGGEELAKDLRDRSRARRERQARTAQAMDRCRTHPARNDLRPELKIVDLPLDALRQPRSRLHRDNEAHVLEVMANIEAFAVSAPILITGDREIIDGRFVVEAARRLGLDSLPCVVIDHLNEEEVRLLRLALNRLPQKAAWDFEALQLEFAELIELGAPVELSGFSLPEIDQILLDDEEEAPEAAELEPDPEAPVVARLGDLWILGDHRLICGDARDPDVYQRLLEGTAVRFLLTDMPYNVKIRGHVTSGDHAEFPMASGEMSDAEFRTFIREWMGEAKRHIVDGGMLATFIDWRGIEATLAVGRELDMDLLNLVVWAKTNAGMGSLWRSSYELLPVFKVGKAPHVNNVELGKNGRWRSNLWTAPGASSLGSEARAGLKLHPTVKPVPLLVDALLDVTHRGEVVLDPFSGSGSALMAAEQTGRLACGIELDPRYIDVTVRRWQDATGDRAILAETGDSFEQVAAQRARGDLLATGDDRLGGE